jgi:hypothetical protein
MEGGELVIKTFTSTIVRLTWQYQDLSPTSVKPELEGPWVAPALANNERLAMDTTRKVLEY